MKILIVGDTIDPQLYDFFKRERFPNKIDLILSTGDLPQWYLSYLISIFNSPLYYVRGNHDYSFDYSPPEGGENIDSKIVNVKELTIIGFEGSMFCHSPKAVQRTEKEIWWQWQKLRLKLLYHSKIDIILTHAPPFGIHDAEDLAHKGFITFSQLIHKYKPRFFIHGHTHYHKRIDIVNKTAVINGYGYYVLDTKKWN